MRWTALRCGSGRDRAKFWRLRIHILDLFEILLHLSGLGFILMLPSLNRNYPLKTRVILRIVFFFFYITLTAVQVFVVF